MYAHCLYSQCKMVICSHNDFLNWKKWLYNTAVAAAAIALVQRAQREPATSYPNTRYTLINGEARENLLLIIWVLFCVWDIVWLFNISCIEYDDLLRVVTQSNCYRLYFVSRSCYPIVSHLRGLAFSNINFHKIIAKCCI